jgi:putative hydrolase of the HAD superfamily
MSMQLLIWDFDGTLAFRDGMWSGTLCEAAAELFPERPLGVSEVRPFLTSGFPWHEPLVSRKPEHPDHWWERLHPLFSAAYRGVGFDEMAAATLAASVRRHFLDVRRWRLFEDTLPTLDALRWSGWRQVILSNHVPELEDLVSALGLNSYIERVFCSALTGYEKPHPEAFNIVQRAYPCAADVVMVGDSLESDVWGAKRAGIRAIRVRCNDDDEGASASNLAGLIRMLCK